MTRVLRITHGDPGTSPQLVEEHVFIAEVESLPAQGELPPGVTCARLPCTIESLDGLGRLGWRAYCSTREGLLDLARELGQERNMATRGGSGPRRPS
jgi:hypothetical protein